MTKNKDTKSIHVKKEPKESWLQIKVRAPRKQKHEDGPFNFNKYSKMITKVQESREKCSTKH